MVDEIDPIDDGVITDGECGLPVWKDPETGEERKLGMLAPTDEEENLLQADELPQLDESKWVVVSHEECKFRVESFLKLYLLNQRSHGSCVGFSAAGALMWVLWEMGLASLSKLSGAYIYSWINGNRDRGASIIAALNALKEHGTCLESTVPWDVIYRRQISSAADEEAKRFMLETGMRVSGYQNIGSAFQVKKPVQIGVQFGNAMQRFDDDGVAGYAGRGSNHSVFVAPIAVRKQRGGGLKFPMINSHGPYGPYKTGWAYVDERHLVGGGGGFLHGTPVLDPKHPDFPPAI